MISPHSWHCQRSLSIPPRTSLLSKLNPSRSASSRAFSTVTREFRRQLGQETPEFTIFLARVLHSVWHPSQRIVTSVFPPPIVKGPTRDAPCLERISSTAWRSVRVFFVRQRHKWPSRTSRTFRRSCRWQSEQRNSAVSFKPRDPEAWAAPGLANSPPASRAQI